MEQAGSETVTRSHNIVYTLPMTAESLAQVIAPALERLDATTGTLQLVILTADAEAAVAVSEVVYQLAGPQGIEAVPVTSANRAARLIEDRPVHVVVGPPLELQTLVQRSTLKLDTIRTVVLAWADDILSVGPDATASLEALFAELPKDSARLLVTRRITDEIEQLIERYLWKARRIGDGEQAPSKTDKSEEATSAAPASIQYLLVSSPARTVGLQRLLDELDPPSAAILVRSANSADVATRAIHQLGYRRADDPVRIVREGAITPGTHTVIFFDAPISRTEVAKATAAVPAQLIALVTPREIATVREVAESATPFTLSGPRIAARQRDRAIRDEILGVLTHGIASRELLALEPLLDQYDGIEIAAAALRLLERERQRAQTLSENARNNTESSNTAPPRRSEFGGKPRGDRPRERRENDHRGGSFRSDRGGDRGGDRGERSDRGERDGGFRRPPRKDFRRDDENKRDSGDRDRAPRSWSPRDRAPRDRDFNNRDSRDRDTRGRGPRDAKPFRRGPGSRDR